MLANFESTGEVTLSSGCGAAFSFVSTFGSEVDAGIRERGDLGASIAVEATVEKFEIFVAAERSSGGNSKTLGDLERILGRL